MPDDTPSFLERTDPETSDDSDTTDGGGEDDTTLDTALFEAQLCDDTTDGPEELSSDGTTDSPCDRLEAVMGCHSNDYELWACGHVHVSHLGAPDISPPEIRAIRESDDWQLHRVVSDGIVVKEVRDDA